MAVTSSNWTYESDEDRRWWGGLWADRVVLSEFARQAVEYGEATSGELEDLSRAFREWAEAPEGLFVVPSVEVLARR